MENRIRIIDQTINEALRLGYGINNMNLILSNLLKYPVEAVDLHLRNWKNNCSIFEQPILSDLVRCVVDASEEEINLAKNLGFTRIIISWTHCAENPSLFELFSALTLAGGFAKELYLCIENASDFSVSELKIYWPAVKKCEVKRFIYRDKNSNLDCFRTFEVLKELKETAPCSIEFVGSNDYGLASSNSLAAIKAEINYISTSIGGIGLYGNAAMEEVLMALKHLWKEKQVPDGSSLAFDCAEILNHIGIELPVDKAIIGKDIFAHESGIHVDGIAKNPHLYEVIKPEDVGLTRKVIIGKHSGTASIMFKFLQWNLKLNQWEAVQILEQVKEIANKQKSSLSDLQLKKLYMKKDWMAG